MFTLIYGLYEYIFKREEYHILILGLDKAGKTNVRLMLPYFNYKMMHIAIAPWFAHQGSPGQLP